MTQETNVVIEQTAEAMARAQFRSSILDHVVDLGLMARWVIDRSFPLPEQDPFTSGTWSVYVWADEQFERLTKALAYDGPVEHQRHAKYRTVRREFGSVGLEVVQTLGVQA